LSIFNEAILHSTASYDYHPRTAAAMQAWFHAKHAGGFPVLGYEDGRGRLMGFASYGAFRPYPANKYAVEHSVYIDGRFRGQGLGEALLRLIIERARQAQPPVLGGGHDAAHAARLRFDDKRGFVHAATIRPARYKVGR